MSNAFLSSLSLTARALAALAAGTMRTLIARRPSDIGDGTASVAQKEAELALNASEMHLAAIIDSAIDAIITVDANQRVILFNESASAMFGCSRADALLSPLERFMPQEVQAILAVARRVPHGPARRLAVLGVRGDGASFPAEASISRVWINTSELVSIIVRDITQKTESEKTRAMLEAQLRESQKLEALGTMAGGIAHDFNNIVAAIMGNAALARERVADPPQALICIDEIAKAGTHARDLVQRILDYSRRQPAATSCQPIQPLICQALTMLRATLPAGIRLMQKGPQEPLLINANATQITQVLMNLGSNACHALRGRSGHIRFTLAQHNTREMRLQVSDNGCGMDAATINHIFEPFFTTKPKGQGTGLGLPVAHGIVVEHGGRIEVYSVKGEGTTFELFLPLALEEKSPSPAVPGLTVEKVRGAGQHIVYVDDYSAMVFMMKATLEARGFRVSGFEDAQAALDFVRANLGTVDLVVTDFNMPGGSGLDVAREVARMRPGLPVIVASGCITDELGEGAREAGVSALFEKARGIDELCKLIASQLHEQSHACA